MKSLTISFFLTVTLLSMIIGCENSDKTEIKSEIDPAANPENNEQEESIPGITGQEESINWENDKSLHTVIGDIFSIPAYRLSAVSQSEISGFNDIANSCSDLTKNQLKDMYPLPEYTEAPRYKAEEILYLTSNSTGSGVDAETAFDMTPEVKLSILNSGFAVDGNQLFNNPLDVYRKIFINDLPVLVTTDAVLHAWHKSYNAILQDIAYELAHKLDIVLTEIQSEIPENFTSEKEYLAYLDIDLLISTAKALLKTDSVTFIYYNPEPFAVIPENESNIESIGYNCIKAEISDDVHAFGQTRENFDFTGFEPRGYFTNSYGLNNYNLENYFRAITWLNSMDIRVYDSPRQFRMAHTLSAIISGNETIIKHLKEIHNVLTCFSGPVNSMTPFDMISFSKEHFLNSVFDMNDEDIKALQEKMLLDGHGQKHIISQYLETDSCDDTSQKYRVMFSFWGNRYTIDSNIIPSIVSNRFFNNNEHVQQMRPSSLNALFTLGDNLSLDLLSESTNSCNNTGNLAAIRKIIETRDNDFWLTDQYHRTLKNLQHLRSTAENAPPVFRQKSWAKKMLAAQLGYWSQLRHTNTPHIEKITNDIYKCEYPHGYVEPYPDFYRGMAEMCTSLKEILDSNDCDYVESFFLVNFRSACTRLASISDKELAGESLTEGETEFLSNWYQEKTEELCNRTSTKYNGQYFKMFYNFYSNMYPTTSTTEEYLRQNGTDESPLFYFEPEIADVHTCPESDLGPFKVLSVATGGALPVFAAVENPLGDVVLYTGAVYDYYEFSDGKRYSDEEWGGLFDAGTVPDKPSWMNDSEGGYITY